jgi:hypothetical protein
MNLRYEVKKHVVHNNHILDDETTHTLEDTLNTYSEDGYKLRSILRESTSNILIFENEYSEFVTIRCFDTNTGEMFYEFERTQPIEFLNIVKSSEVFNLNTNKGLCRGTFVESEFHLVDAKNSVSEILYIYFDLSVKFTKEVVV